MERDCDAPPPAAVGPLVPPLLLALGLSAGELTALKRQGVVKLKLRGRKCAAYYLVFRLDKRQRAKYLGSDAAQAARLGSALAEWQGARRIELQLRQLDREAGQILRAARRRLAQPLESVGMHLHGQHIRRRREN